MTRYYGDDVVDGVLIGQQDVALRVAELGTAISREYAGQDLRLVTILKGSVIFLADLCRAIDIPVTLDFMAVSSYADGRGGVVRLVKDLDDSIEGASVLLVEDIIDTGLTLNYILSVLRQRAPRTLAVCTLLDKDVRRIVDLPIVYSGFAVPDRFLVGYGLDLDGKLRNLPYVATVKEHVID